MYCVIQNGRVENGYTRIDNMGEKKGRSRGRNPGEEELRNLTFLCPTLPMFYK